MQLCAIGTTRKQIEDKYQKSMHYILVLYKAVGCMAVAVMVVMFEFFSISFIEFN